MAGARVQAVSNSSTNSNSLAVTFAAAGAGNLLVAAVCVSEVLTPFDHDINTPAGWTAISLADINNTTKVRGRMFFMVAAGGETSVTFTQGLSLTTDMAAYVMEFSGTATTSPEDQAAETTGTTSPSVTGTMGSPVAGAIGVGYIAIVNTNTLNTPAGGYTLEGTVVSGNATAAQAVKLAMLYDVSSPSTASGVNQGGTARPYVGQIVSFKPSAGTTFNQTLAVTSTMTAAMVRSPGKILAVAATFTAAMVRKTNKALAVAATFTAALLKSVGKNLTVSGTWTAALTTSKAVGQALAVGVTFTASMIRRTGKGLAATGVWAVALVKRAGKTLAVAGTWTVTVVRQTAKALAVAVTLTAAMLRSTGKALAVGVTFTAAMLRRAGKTLAASGSWTVGMTKRVGKILAAAGSWVANLVAASTVKPIQTLVALFDRMWTAVFLRDRQLTQVTDVAQTSVGVSERAMTTVYLSDRAVQPNTATDEEV